jgi:uncharacterized protein
LFAGLLYGIDLSQSAEHAMPLIAPRPVLLIHGTADQRTPVDNAYRLKAASTSPNVELWIVPGAAHVEAYLSDPQLYTTKIVKFLHFSARQLTTDGWLITRLGIPFTESNPAQPSDEGPG